MAIEFNLEQLIGLIQNFQDQHLNEETINNINNTINLNNENNQFRLTRFISCFSGNILSPTPKMVLISYKPSYTGHTDADMEGLTLEQWLNGSVEFFNEGNNFHQHHLFNCFRFVAETIDPNLNTGKSLSNLDFFPFFASSIGTGTMNQILSNVPNLPVIDASENLMNALLDNINVKFLLFHGKAWETYFQAHNIHLIPLIREETRLINENNNLLREEDPKRILSVGKIKKHLFFYSHKFFKFGQGQDQVFYEILGNQILEYLNQNLP